MANALVTGGAGFLGSHVAEALRDAGYAVTALDDLSGGFEDNVPPGVTFVKGSITDTALLEHLFVEGRFEYVFHLAAYAAEGLSHFIRHFNYTNNLIGSINLVNLGVRHKIKCFVFTSSIAVYGEAPLPMTEDMMPRPIDPYGIAKYAVELDLAAAGRQFGLPYVVFRPHNVYGERQNIGDRYRNVVGIFMNQVLQGQELTIFGDGEQTRAFTHVADVVPAIVRSVGIPDALGQVFNVGGDRACTVNELARHVFAAMGRETALRHLPDREEVKHAHASHAKAERILGVRATVSIEEGVRRMAAWVRRHGARSPSRFGAIEIEEGLPPSWRRA